MDGVAALPADPRAAEPVRVGDGALDNPASGAKSGAVVGAASRDQWLHAEFADEVAVPVVVVAAVTRHDGAAARVRRAARHAPVG